MAANKRKILENARKLAQKGSKDKALGEYQKLLRLDPKDAKLRLEIGDAHRRWGQVEEAIDTYSKVAEQYTKEGFDARAVAVYKQILNLDPDRQASYVPLAELYERMGLTAEAIQALQTAADGYHRAGDKREALNLLRRMATIDPTNTTSRIKVADLLRQEGMADEALTEYEQVADELERQGDVEAAAKAYRRMLEIEPDRVGALVQLARNLLGRGKAKEAEPFAKSALASASDEPEHYELLAEIYRGSGRNDELPALYRSLSDVYRRRGDEERARDILQRYVPSDAIAMEASGEADLIAGEPGDDEFLETDDLAAGDAMFGDASLGDSHLDLGPPLDSPNPLAAMEEPAPSVRARPAPIEQTVVPVASADEKSGAAVPSGDPEQLLAEASVYLRYGKRDKAIAHLEAILVEEPDHRIALEKLGEAYAEGGDDARAVETWLHAAKLARAVDDEAAVAVLRGRIAALDETAAASLEPPAPPPEPEPEPELDLSDSVADAARADAEEAEGDDGLDLDIDLDVDVDDLHADAGDDDEAVAGASASAAAARNSISGASLSTATTQQILEDLEEADFYMQQGLLDEAEGIYKRVLSVAPNHPRALVRLGEVAAARGEEPVAKAAAAAPAAATPAPAAATPAAARPRRAEAAPEPVAASRNELQVEEPEESLADSLDLGDLDDIDLGDDDDATDAATETAAEDEGEADAGGDTEELAAAPAGEAPPPAAVPPRPAPRAPVAAKPTPVAGRPIVGAAKPTPVAAKPAPPPAPAARAAPGLAALDDSDDAGFDLAKALSEAFEDDPDGASVSGLGDTADVGFEAVFEAFKKGVSETLSEADHEAHYDLGIAYKEMGLHDDAIREFEVAMKSPARQVECLHLIGLCALDAGRPEEAARQLEKHLALPRLSEEQKLAGGFDLGSAYAAMGDRARARSTWKAVAAVDPDFCGVSKRLAALDDPDGGPGARADAEQSFESFEDVILEAQDEEDDDEEAAQDPGESFQDLFEDASADEEPEPATAAVPVRRAPEPDGPEPPPARAPRPAPAAPERRRKKKKISFV